MKTKHIILMYLIGAVLLLLIKEARASECVEDALTNYETYARKDGIKLLKQPLNDQRAIDYCICLDNIVDTSNPDFSKLIPKEAYLQCKAKSRLYEMIQM